MSPVKLRKRYRFNEAADTLIMRLRVVEHPCRKFVPSKSSNFLRERENEKN